MTTSDGDPLDDAPPARSGDIGLPPQRGAHPTDSSAAGHQSSSDVGPGTGRVWSTWYPAVAIGATLIASALAYSHLPTRMAIHWGLRGEPNGWATRTVGAFLLPDLALVVWLLMRWLPRTDPHYANYAKFRGAYFAVINAVVTLLLVLHVAVLAIALGWPIPIAIVVQVSLGLLFVLIGRALPRARPNWYFGIRTPWTLSSDAVWERTHHVGGHALVMAGLIMIAASVLPPTVGFPIGLAALLIASLLPVVSSYVWWSREQRH